MEKKKTTKKVTKKTVNKTKTSAPKKIVKKIEKPKDVIAKKDSVITKLKKEIRESEKILNNEKNVRKTGFIFFTVFCFIVIILSITLIDYSNASLKNTEPKFAIKSIDKSKNVTNYYGVFYKAWKCNDTDDILIFVTYNTESPTCSYTVTYDTEGYYTNPYGIKISKEQMASIYNYYKDYLNEWKKESDLADAYTLSNEFNKIWWVKKEDTIKLEDGTEAGVAIFNKLINNNDEYSWEIQYLDESYYKCVRNSETNVYEFSDYDNGFCTGEWKKLSLNENVCELVKNDKSFIKDIVNNGKLCE